jgi:hypothetical protein
MRNYRAQEVEEILMLVLRDGWQSCVLGAAVVRSKSISHAAYESAGQQGDEPAALKF